MGLWVSFPRITNSVYCTRHSVLGTGVGMGRGCVCHEHPKTSIPLYPTGGEFAACRVGGLLGVNRGRGRGRRSGQLGFKQGAQNGHVS